MVAHSMLSDIGSLEHTPTIMTPTITTYAALTISDNGNPYAQLALVTAHEAREHIAFSYTLIGSLSVRSVDLVPFRLTNNLTTECALDICMGRIVSLAR